jgi:hypothetical protein
VLANDDDPDGDALTAVLVDDVTDGSLALNDDGSFTYTPDAGFSGTDGFTYRADDGVARSDVANVEITVEAASNPVIEGPAIGGMLAGTPADEVLVPGAGALTTVSGNGGADDIDLRGILGDGARQVVRVLDYEQDDRLLGPTADDVLYAFESGATTTLLLDGGDRDQIMVTGAPTQDDITFADPDLFVA